MYFVEERGETAPKLQSSEHYIREQSALSFRAKLLIGGGAVLVAWGLIVLLVAPHPIVLILILPGLAMIITPIWKSMKLRRELREKAERERAEREETERHNREMVGEFAAVLENYQKNHGPGSAERVRRSREGREIPYDAVAGMARETVQRIGFDAVSRFEKSGAAAVAREIDEAASAVGLNQADAALVKRQIYQRLVWHLLADDHFGERAARELDAFRRALAISDEEATVESESATQFGFLRGMRVGALPNVDSPVPLKFQEVCHHRSRGQGRKPGRKGSWKSMGDRYLTVTSRRIVLSNGKQIDIPYEELRNVEADADARTLTLETVDETHTLAIPDPIYTAGVISVAAETRRKPKGLV